MSTATQTTSTRRHKRTDANALRKTVHDLAAAISNGDSDATFDRYLSWISHFHRYSFGNICLMMFEWLARQDKQPGLPPLSHTAGFRTWKKLGRSVKRGEKGIPILVPMNLKARTVTDEETGEEDCLPARTFFRVGHVFDVSQTDGDELPNFKRDLGDDVAAVIPDLVRFAEGMGIIVEFALTGVANGMSRGGKVTVSADNPPGIQAQTLVHEIAHELLHQRADDRHRLLKDNAFIEGEAEAVSVVVMRALGHDVASNGAAYIRSHGADEKTVLRSLERITETARTILDGISTEDGDTER